MEPLRDSLRRTHCRANVTNTTNRYLGKPVSGLHWFELNQLTWPNNNSHSGSTNRDSKIEIDDHMNVGPIANTE